MISDISIRILLVGDGMKNNPQYNISYILGFFLVTFKVLATFLPSSHYFDPVRNTLV